MKIALLAHFKHPIVQPYAGGLEMHTHLLTEALQRRSHKVTLFAAHGSDAALVPKTICRPTGEDFGDPDEAHAIAAAEFAAYTEAMEAIAQGDFDLVHNNSLHDVPLRASRQLDIPMVTALHTPPFTSLAAGVRAAAADMVFTAVSEHLAHEWLSLVPHPRVIGNGIDLHTFTFQAEPSRPAYAFWSGRIVPEKGLHLAIDAARLAGLPLAFAGPRTDVAYWTAEIAPRLGQDLIDLGHLSHGALAAHLGRACVALVTPCWEEPFGLVVAEALACGTPVAAFARGALPDLVARSCGRFGRRGDVADLARAIREALILDRRDCRACGEALFDAETMTDHYEELYRSVLANVSSRTAAEPDRLLEALAV